MIDGLIGWPQLKKRATESRDKIGFGVECFRSLHEDAPDYDLDDDLGGRIAGIIKQAGGDYIRVFQIMWITSAQGIQGSHLDYIQKTLSRQQAQNRVNTVDPNKFKAGRYGHMVKG